MISGGVAELACLREMIDHSPHDQIRHHQNPDLCGAHLHRKRDRHPPFETPFRVDGRFTPTGVIDYLCVGLGGASR